MELLKRVREFIRKDTGGQNESPKLIFVTRLILILCIIYNLVGTVASTIGDKGKGIVPYVAFFFAFLIVFIFSYFGRTIGIILLSHSIMIIWVHVFLHYFGWSSGIATVLVLLLVMNFFSGYRHSIVKIVYANALVVFHIGFFAVYHNRLAICALNYKDMRIVQGLNTFFVFLCISVICYIFSRDSQELEGKLVEYNIQLVNQANTDPLTGLNNRRKTMEIIKDMLDDTQLTAACICICDIDHFKNVNDTYGHDIGDKVLKSLAQTMVQTLDEKCFISRWGGEEFLIVFAHTNGDEALFKLEGLRKKVSQLNFEVKDRSFKVTLTYGLTEYDFHSDIQTLIKEADNKLYIGKENGRDQIVF